MFKIRTHRGDALSVVAPRMLRPVTGPSRPNRRRRRWATADHHATAVRRWYTTPRRTSNFRFCRPMILRIGGRGSVMTDSRDKCPSDGQLSAKWRQTHKLIRHELLRHLFPVIRFFLRRQAAFMVIMESASHWIETCAFHRLFQKNGWLFESAYGRRRVW